MVANKYTWDFWNSHFKDERYTKSSPFYLPPPLTSTLPLPPPRSPPPHVPSVYPLMCEWKEKWDVWTMITQTPISPRSLRTLVTSSRRRSSCGGEGRGGGYEKGIFLWTITISYKYLWRYDFRIKHSRETDGWSLFDKENYLFLFRVSHNSCPISVFELLQRIGQ